MSTKEEILSELNSLSQSELDLIAQYLAFIKHKNQIEPIPIADEARLAEVYAEFSEEDRHLAEEGISDYMDAVIKEDGK